MGTSQAQPPLVRFGVFEADLRTGELRRNGVKVRVQDLPFRVLALFVSRPGDVITREEFRKALWPPDVFVDFEQGISSAVMRLRDALRDSADNPIFIETIERRGYRWIGPIQTPEAVQEKPEENKVPEDSVVLPVQGKTLPWRQAVAALGLVLLLIWILRPSLRSARTEALPSAAHAPANREAEDLYLKGRFYWNKRTPESLNQAVDAFTQAIVHDPNYADAYVGLADCYNLLREFAAMPSREAYSRAFVAAKKAVELNDRSSDAHASLAFATFWGMWDAPNAEREFRRAIELDPRNAKAHHWFATSLDVLDRHREALAEIELARKLDPNSSSILADKGELLRDAGRHEEALQLLWQMEAAEPDFVSPHRYLKFAYFADENYPDYIAELKKEALLTRDESRIAEADAAAKGFAEGGKEGMLKAQLAQQKKIYEQGKLSPYYVAETESKLGDLGETLRYLTLCVQSHDELALQAEQDQSFMNLHGNPEFQQLVAKMGLPARH